MSSNSSETDDVVDVCAVIIVLCVCVCVCLCVYPRDVFLTDSSV